MTQKTDKAAILSTTMRFLTAGGLTLGIALAQEVAKPDRDWSMIATMVAGILIGIGGAPMAAPRRKDRSRRSCRSDRELVLALAEQPAERLVGFGLEAVFG
jgi:hypothetical protein